MTHATNAGRRAGARVAALAAAVAMLAGCTGSSDGSGSDGSASTRPASTSAGTPAGTAASTGPASAAATGPLQPALSPYSKVMVIAMENKTEEQVFGSGDAPFLTRLAADYGRPRRLDAGYPATCPSLAAYLLMTSGMTHDVCDDKNPSAHPIDGDNVFQQVAVSGREWRNYAESMPDNCHQTNGRDGLYVVRHAPAAYYLTERERCQRWDVPLGTLTAGPLHDDLAAGALPAFSFVTPNNCNNMHGALLCPIHSVQIGDTWISSWVPKILAGPDFASGRLLVIITWDEGTKQDNHIPAVLLSPSTTAISSQKPYTQCSVVRTMQEVLRVPLLGCATAAPSLLAEFKLAG